MKRNFALDAISWNIRQDKSHQDRLKHDNNRLENHGRVIKFCNQTIVVETHIMQI